MSQSLVFACLTSLIIAKTALKYMLIAYSLTVTHCCHKMTIDEEDPRLVSHD